MIIIIRYCYGWHEEDMTNFIEHHEKLIQYGLNQDLNI
jgi:hypothetical protein